MKFSWVSIGEGDREAVEGVIPPHWGGGPPIALATGGGGGYKKNIAVAGGIFRMPRKEGKEKKKRAF